MTDSNQSTGEKVRDFPLRGMDLIHARKTLYVLTTCLTAAIMIGFLYWRYVNSGFDIAGFIKWGVLIAAFVINWIIISTFIYYQEKAKKEQEYLLLKIELLTQELKDKEKLLNSYVSAIMELEIPFSKVNEKSKVEAHDS